MRNRRSLVAGLLVSMIGWNCPCNKILKLKKIGVSIRKNSQMYQTFLVTEKLKFFYLNNLRPYKENSIRL